MIHASIMDIAEQLRRHFIDSKYVASEMSLFVCGGASRADSRLRAALGSRLMATKSKYAYVVYYPESMFVEAILGHKRRDLLELENLLAESVSAVVIPLHSPGTFSELGAFSNHPRLREKLVVVVEPKYRLDNSFLNTGPIRHLKRNTGSAVLYHELSLATVDSLAKAVAEAARKIALKSPVKPSLINPLSSLEFYFFLAATLEPLPRQFAIEIAQSLDPSEKDRNAVACDTVYDLLVNERRILTKDGVFMVPARSLEKTFAEISTVKRRRETMELIWGLRTKALNCIHRRKSVAWR